MSKNRYSGKELNAILTSFKVPDQDYSFRPLTDGFINDTFLVLDGNAPLYILQRINHKVFTNVSGLMNNIRNAFEHLKDVDYTAITLVKSKVGKDFYTDDHGNCFWRVMTYIDGTTAYNTTEDPKIAFEAGKIIAKFNMLLQAADINDYIDSIPRFHDLDLRSEQFNLALSTADTTRFSTAESAIRFAQEVLHELKGVYLTDLPLRICHNDTKLNNILFSKDTKKALCLIDLDTLMRGYFLYDFGDAVRTIVNSAPEDEQEHHKITFDQELFEAFIDGLAANGNFLSKKEIETLHWGAVLMPFLHGIRALTDYLNGNIYYKTAYENQNLDRCLSLFNFTKKALHHRRYMVDIIQKKLS